MRNYHDIFIKCESVFHFFSGCETGKEIFQISPKCTNHRKNLWSRSKLCRLSTLINVFSFTLFRISFNISIFCSLNVVGPSEKFDWIDWVRYDDWGDMDRSILFIQIRIPFSSESTSIKFSVYLTENRESEFLLRQWVEMQVLDGSWNWKILALSNKMKTI